MDSSVDNENNFFSLVFLYLKLINDVLWEAFSAFSANREKDHIILLVVLLQLTYGCGTFYSSCFHVHTT